MTYILQLSDDPYFVNHETVLRSLHFMMTSYEMKATPGRWRPGAIHVQRGPAGQIVYQAPDAALVPGLIAELVAALNASNHFPIMVRAALAHLNLVMIHPFSDGNGRMARALQTLLLAREGILDPTFSSIEEYLGRNTQPYYDVLAEVGQGSWHPENDSLPWIKFCLVAHYRQAETLLRRIEESGRLGEIIAAELVRRKLQERQVAALMDAAYGYRVRNNTYRKAADVSDAIASRDLGQLVSVGLLIAKGEKRGRYYEAGDWVKAQPPRPANACRTRSSCSPVIRGASGTNARAIRAARPIDRPRTRSDRAVFQGRARGAPRPAAREPVVPLNSREAGSLGFRTRECA